MPTRAPGLTILGYGSDGRPRDGRRNDCNCCVPHRRLHSLFAPGGGGAGGTCPHRIRGPLGPEGPCDANWRLRVHAGIFDSEGPHRARKNTLCAPNSHTSLHKSHTPAFYCSLSAFEGPLPASQGPLATSEGYLPASEGPYRPIRDQQL